MSAPSSINPFYIEPSEVNERSAWHDDTDDLEELLEHDASPEAYQSSNRRSSTRRGRLPVSNLAYDDEYDSDWNGTQRRRLRLALLGLLGLIVIWTIVSRNSLPDRTQKPINGRYEDGDDDADGEEDSDDSTTDPQPQSSPAVRTIAVLGERNSGLSWLTTTLQSCYPDLLVQSSLSREGMWFQDDEEENSDSSRPPTLVVSVFSNPYDWVERMRVRPRNAPSHAKSLSWEAFVTKPWTLDGYSDMKNASSSSCQLGFAPNRVVPCVADKSSDNPAVYELNPVDGTVFPSIVDLRAAKIREFVQGVAAYSYVEGIVTVQYEQLVGDAVDKQQKHSGLPGLLTTLNEIKQRLGGSEYRCDVISDKSLFAPPVEDHKKLTQEFVAWMNAHADWEAEALVGYSQWTRIPPSQVAWDESNPEGLTQDDDDLAEYEHDEHANEGSNQTASPQPKSGTSTTATTNDSSGGTTSTATDQLSMKPTAGPTDVGTIAESNSTAPTSNSQTDPPTAGPSPTETPVTSLEPTANDSSGGTTSIAIDQSSMKPTAGPTNVGTIAESNNTAPTSNSQTDPPTAGPNPTETTVTSLEPTAATSVSKAFPTAAPTSEEEVVIYAKGTTEPNATEDADASTTAPTALPTAVSTSNETEELATNSTKTKEPPVDTTGTPSNITIPGDENNVRR